MMIGVADGVDLLPEATIDFVFSLWLGVAAYALAFLLAPIARSGQAPSRFRPLNSDVGPIRCGGYPHGACLLIPFILRYANIAIGRLGRLTFNLRQFLVLRTAARFLAPVLAVVLAIDWFIARSTLTIEDATRLEVTATRIVRGAVGRTCT